MVTVLSMVPDICCQNGTCRESAYRKDKRQRD